MPQLESNGELSQEWFSQFDFTRLGIVLNRFSNLSDRVIHTNPAGTVSNQTASSSYAKCAEILVNEAMDLVRVRWDVARISPSGGGSSDYRDSAVFINGVQVSGDFNVGFGSSISLSYDIPTGLSAGDLVQIYARRVGNTEQFLRVSNFTLNYDSEIESIAGIPIANPLVCTDPSPIDATNNL